MKDNTVVKLGFQHVKITVFRHLDSLKLFYIFVIFLAFQAKSFMGVPNDAAVGHMLVLLQHDWPHQEDLLLDLIHRIQTQGSFRYNLFFNYVTSILFDQFSVKNIHCGNMCCIFCCNADLERYCKTRNVRGY